MGKLVETCFLILVATLLGQGVSWGLTISPLPFIEIPIGGKHATLKLTGDDKFYEARIVKVQQDPDGTERHEETGDLIVYPSPFKAPRSIRVAMAAPIQRAEEGYYRVIVREIRPQVEGETGVKVVMEFSIPVFVRPKKMEELKKITCGERIQIENMGNVTQKFIRENAGPLYVRPRSSVTIKKAKLATPTGEVVCE